MESCGYGFNFTALKNALNTCYKANHRCQWEKRGDTVYLSIGGYVAVKTSNLFVVDQIKEKVKSVVGFVPDDYFDGVFYFEKNDCSRSGSRFVEKCVNDITSKNTCKAYKTSWKYDGKFETRLYVMEDGNVATINTLYDSILEDGMLWSYSGSNSVSPVFAADGDLANDTTTLVIFLPVRIKADVMDKQVTALAKAIVENGVN